MNVNIITPYSYPSKCGIWKRAASDVIILNKKYPVHIITSHILKGTAKKLPLKDSYHGIPVDRKRVLFRIKNAALFFFFPITFIQSKANIVVTHGYRHPHSLQSLILGIILRRKVFLISHGPFKKDPRRSIVLKAFDLAYDLLIGWWELKLYAKIIYISKWEVPFLRRRGAPKRKLVHIPNSIDAVFFKNIPDFSKPIRDKVLYMGRIDKVKRPEWLLNAAKAIPKNSFTLSGPVQMDSSLLENTPENVTIINQPYEATDFIKTAQSHSIFVLPSIRESFGIVILEAMSQGLIVIASATMGAQELITQGKNGFIVKDEEELIVMIRKVQSLTHKERVAIQKAARKTAEQYSQEVLGEKLLQVIQDTM